MKKYLYIFTLLLGVMYLTSCSEHERTTYGQGDEVQVLFPVSKAAYEVEAADMGSLIVKIYRSNTKGSLKAPFKLDLKDLDSELGFKVDSTHVIFKNGENVANIVVKYNYEEFGAVDKYTFTLSLADENQYPIYAGESGTTSPAFASIDVTVNRKLDFEAIDDGSWFIPLYGGGPYRCKFEKAEAEGSLYYRAINFIEDNQRILFIIDGDNNVTVDRQVIETGGYEGNDITINGSGKKVGNVLNLSLLYYVPALGGGFGWQDDVITLPESEK